MPDNPLLLSVDDTCKLLNIHRTLFYSMISTGQFGPLPLRLGRRRMYRRADVERWIEFGAPAREKFLVLTGGKR